MSEFRFEPGKVYEACETPTRVLCLTDEPYGTTPLFRRMYYVLLQSFDGTTPDGFRAELWIYKTKDADNYYLVEE